MSVYKPQKGRFWWYDFQLKGVRYHGSTGATTRSKAERVEEANRVRAAKGELNGRHRSIPTLDDAAGAWWRSKQHLRTADELQRRAGAAVALIGADKPVNEVTFSDVQRAIQKRRGQLIAGRKVPTGATVNRDLIATLRPIIKLARQTLNDGDGTPVHFPEINWGALRQPERKPKAKDFSPAELEAVYAALPGHLVAFARFQARYGCRLGEMFFGLGDVDVEGRRLLLRDRKAGDDHTIPLTEDDAADLAARVGRARTAGLETVWFREERIGRERVRLLAVTYDQAQRALGAAITAAGLRAKGARGSHDLRHHAGMQMLRATGNLRVTQKLLGHASIQSTLVYAHAVEDDLRSALDKLSRPIPEPHDEAASEVADKQLKERGKC